MEDKTKKFIIIGASVFTAIVVVTLCITLPLTLRNRGEKAANNTSTSSNTTIVSLNSTFTTALLSINTTTGTVPTHDTSETTITSLLHTDDSMKFTTSDPAETFIQSSLTSIQITPNKIFDATQSSLSLSTADLVNETTVIPSSLKAWRK